MIQDRKHRIVFGEKIANVVDSAKHAVMRDMAGETCKSERRDFRGAHLMTIWTLDTNREYCFFDFVVEPQCPRCCGQYERESADKIFYFVHC